jgi:hypothetical protein
MSDSRQASICIFAPGDAHEQFHRCFHGILNDTPLERIELRLAFAQSRHSFQYTLGVLVPDDAWPARQRLPGGVDRGAEVCGTFRIPFQPDPRGARPSPAALKKETGVPKKVS